MERAGPDVCGRGTRRAGARRCALRRARSVVWKAEHLGQILYAAAINKVVLHFYFFLLLQDSTFLKKNLSK